MQFDFGVKFCTLARLFFHGFDLTVKAFELLFQIAFQVFRPIFQFLALLVEVDAIMFGGLRNNAVLRCLEILRQWNLRDFGDR